MRNKVFKTLAAVAAVASLASCVAANYSKDLDSCLSAGSREAINACMCQVAQQYGRSCAPFEDDGGKE